MNKHENKNKDLVAGFVCVRLRMYFAVNELWSCFPSTLFNTAWSHGFVVHPCCEEGSIMAWKECVSLNDFYSNLEFLFERINANQETLALEYGQVGLVVITSFSLQLQSRWRLNHKEAKIGRPVHGSWNQNDGFVKLSCSHWTHEHEVLAFRTDYHINVPIAAPKFYLGEKRVFDSIFHIGMNNIVLKSIKKRLKNQRETVRFFFAILSTQPAAQILWRL